MKRLIVVLVLALAGCGASVNIIKIGPNTYEATATGETGLTTRTTVKKEAFAAATRFCENQAKVMYPKAWGPGNTYRNSFYVVFWALDPDHPLANRPVGVRPPADITVDVRTGD